MNASGRAFDVSSMKKARAPGTDTRLGPMRTPLSKRARFEKLLLNLGRSVIAQLLMGHRRSGLRLGPLRTGSEVAKFNAELIGRRPLGASTSPLRAAAISSSRTPSSRSPGASRAPCR